MSTFMVMGTAPSLLTHDLSELQDLQYEDKITTIGCNGILRTGYIPDYLMISDRRPYIEEMNDGLLEENADRCVILLSNTIWDNGISCGGTPVQQKPSFRHLEWRVGAASTPFNWTSFKTPLCSFATTAGQMIQGAVILGATRIGIIGVDLQVPEKDEHGAENLHCYPDRVSREAATVQKDGKTMAPPVTYDLFRRAKSALEKKGIEVKNLSPEKETAFAKIFDTGDYRTFLASL